MKKRTPEEPNSGFNRRQFLRTSVTGIGGLLILDTLTQCSDDIAPLGGDFGAGPDGSSPDGAMADGSSPDAGIADGPSADSMSPDQSVTDGGGYTPPDDVFKTWPTTFTQALIPTTCWIGKQDCGMIAKVLKQTVNGKSIDRLVKLEGNPDNPRNNGKLCPKGVAQVQAIYDYNRIKWPLERTNAKGIPGQFKQITWAAALARLKTELNDCKTNNKRLLWQKGRSKAKDFYDDALVGGLKAYGISTDKIGHGTYCSDSGYRACEYTLGYHGVINPDFAYTEYLLSWGWGLTTSGGNKFCWLTWPQKFLAAKEAGTLKKVVCLDPNRRQTGPHSDEWLPNKPGSDVAFFLGIANYLLNNTASGFADGLIDKEYLSKYTNSTHLVGDDGMILRINDKEQVWDTTSSSVKDFDAAGITPALVGTFSYDDGGGAKSYKPALQVFKDGLATNTPTWADGVTGLPAGTVESVAKDLFKHATIGATITIDGITLPHRPVGMMAYHVSQQETGFNAIRAGINVFQLLGAIGVPGGISVDFSPSSLYKNYDALNKVAIKTTNLDYKLEKSKFFPINSASPSFFHRVQLNPTKYDVDAATIPKKVLMHMCDPVVSFTDSTVIREAYAKFEFVADVSPWLSETSDHFADLILPAATLEKYEGPMKSNTHDEIGYSLRVPPVAPLWQSKGEIDIYLDLASEMGFLADYMAIVNSKLKLTGTANEVAASPKPTAKSIFDAWAKSKGVSGIDYFETYNATGTKGVTTVTKYTADKKYTAAANHHGGIHRLYGESLLGYQNEMKAAGVDAIYYQDYTATPQWRPPTMWGSESKGYNLCLLSHKQVIFKQSRASFVPMLAELAPEQGLLINPKTAAGLGIADGDAITVTSHNAVTEETRSVTTKAVFYEALRPDVVSMSHHYGLTTHPATTGQGPTPNLLYFAGEGYIQCTNDASFHVMVKVAKV